MPELATSINLSELSKEMNKVRRAAKINQKELVWNKKLTSY